MKAPNATSTALCFAMVVSVVNGFAAIGSRSKIQFSSSMTPLLLENRSKVVSLRMSMRSNDSELKASTVFNPLDDNIHEPESLSRNGRRFQLWKSNTRSFLRKLLHNIRSDEVTQWRCAALLFVSSLVFFHNPIDNALAKLWTYLTTSSGLWARWFRHDRTSVLSICFVSNLLLEN